MQNPPREKHFRIDARAVEEVRARADILEVVGERVALKKTGRDHKGLCPFHDERTPSFYVSPLKGIFKCFGCGAGGDVFEFVSKFESIPFTEAVVELARHYGVFVEASSSLGIGADKTSGTVALQRVCAAAADFFERTLWSNEGKEARLYLEDARGLDEGTIRRFRLGYAPARWTALKDYLLKVHEFEAQLVEAAGLMVARSSSGGYYDRFRGRIIVPILDHRGRVIAFGGRSLDGSEPKYLNSPETELFEKGKILFALDKAREAFAREDGVIVVEGYFDAIALHRSGINNAVAVLGTALSKHQMEQLVRFTPSKRLVLAFDNDTAGAKATERATEELASMVYRSGTWLGVLELPEAKDADEFLRTHSAQNYRMLVLAAPDWFTWRARRVLIETDPGRTTDLERILGSLGALLALPMDAAVREKRVRDIATGLARGGGGLAVKIEEVLRQRTIALQAPSRALRSLEAATTPMSPIARAELQILMVYLHHAEMRESIHRAAEQFAPLFTEPVHTNLWAVLEEVRYTSTKAIVFLREALAEDAEGSARLEALLWPAEWEQHAITRPDETVKAALAFLLVGRYEAELGRLGALSDEAEARGDWEESLRLMGLYQKQATRIRELHALLAFKPPL